VANSITIKLVGGDRFVADSAQWLMRLRHIIAAATRRRAAEILSRTRSYYPRGATGNLIKGLSVREVQGDNSRVLEQVRSRAPHAHLNEWGTKTRRTKKGWSRGVMPRKTVFVPIAIQERAKLMQDIRRILAGPAPEIGPGYPHVVETPTFFGNRGRL
jgi:hypothetical protein